MNAKSIHTAMVELIAVINFIRRTNAGQAAVNFYIALLISATFLGKTQSFLPDSVRKQFKTVKITPSTNADVLNESEWNLPGPLSSFIQIDPHQRKAPNYAKPERHWIFERMRDTSCHWNELNRKKCFIKFGILKLLLYICK